MNNAQLGSVFSYMSRGKSPRYVDYSNIHVINQACIRWDGIDFSKVKFQNTESVKADAVLRPGDVLISSTGTGTLGRCCVFFPEKNDVTYVADSHVTIIRGSNKVLPLFVKYYFMCETTQRELYTRCVNGSTNQIELSKEKLKAFVIPVPSIEDQRLIVDILSEIDRVRKLLCEKAEELDRLVKSRFVELFGDVTSCPKYGGVALGTICTTLSGGTPTTKVPEYYDGDIPWISSPYLGSNHINGSSAKAYITEDAIKNSATHLIPANTIMFGIRVGVGKSSIIDEPMCANQDIVALMGIDTNKYNLLFVKHVLDAYQSHFDSIKKGATILGITTEDLKKVLVPTVDIDLQNQFAAFVEQTDKSKLAVQQGLQELEILKKSLMQQYFG